MEPRPAFRIRFADGGTLELDRRTAVMGVLNVTPDSFSDGGACLSLDAALDRAAAMTEAGAALVDVGGESTRPGARPVSEAEEARRVLPVIEAVKRRIGVRVSVDTRRSAVARQALDAGADLVNDVSGLGDPQLLPLLRERQVPVVIMHMRGEPETMQLDTRYPDVVAAVRDFLLDRVAGAVAAGLSDDKILVDPGIGFGKSASGSLQILRRLGELHEVGRPILLGVSRKSFIGAVLDLPVGDRLEGSLAIAAYASAQGAHVIRAHDVAATVRAVRMIDAVRELEPGVA